MFKINYLQECICFDLKLGSRLCTTVSLSRSSSQSIHEIENFSNKLNLTVESVTQKNPGHQNGGRMIRQLKKVLK